jgi:RNA polymerase sigma-B factor
VDLTRQHEEHVLFSRLRAHGRDADREQAVHRYLPLARSLAHRYRYSGEPTDDLEQVASLGLLKAIDRFDPARGSAFSSFAVPTILGELRRHFRDRTWALRAPRPLQELTVRIEEQRDVLTSALGRQPTIAELAERLNTSDEQILQALELDAAHHLVPLEGEDTDDTPGRIDDGYARAEDRAVLLPLLGTLSARDAEIVLLRFRNDLTQDDIARRVGVSQMQVSRVLSRSLAQLREASVFANGWSRRDGSALVAGSTLRDA